MKTLAYVRVSTEEQARHGVSLDAQEEQARRYCELHGLELDEVLRDEGQSGKDMDRPAMRVLLDRVSRGAVKAVVVYRLDRVSRSTMDALRFAEALRAAGVAFHSVCERLDTQTADGGFMFTLQAAQAERERKLVSERTRAALAHKKTRGEWLGRPPFGYRVEDKRLVEDDQELSLIAKAKRLRRAGHSIRAIAKRLAMPKSTVNLILRTHGRTRKSRYTAA